MMSLNL